MKQQLQFPDPKPIHLFVGFVMASLWSLFSYRHLIAFYATGQLAYVAVCLSETITAAFFAFRSMPKTISVAPLDWIFAIAGTFLPLLFVPASWGLLPSAKYLVVLGTALQIFGLMSLNRSFALVAAKRQLKTKGMYRYVRHPLYASYLIMFGGYILTNTTWMNFFLYVITIGLLFARIVREEKHLVVDPMYADYMQKVRYRIIPYVF